MKPDTRFVQDVKHPRQARPQLRSQPDPLEFTSGESNRSPVQGEVAQPDFIKELQPPAYFLYHRAHRLLAVRRDANAFHPCHSLLNRESTELMDPKPSLPVFTSHLHGQKLPLQSTPSAGLTAA